MRLSTEQVKSAVLHRSAEVRELAISYFADAFSQDPSIMPLAIEGIQRYGRDAFGGTSFVQKLFQTTSTVSWIIEEIKSAGAARSKRKAAYVNGLTAALQRVDPILLSRHERAIESLACLDDATREAITARIKNNVLNAPALWRKLAECCEQLETLTPTSRTEYDFSSAIVDQLAAHPCTRPNDVVRRLVALADGSNEWLEIMTVQMAGKIGAGAAILPIADRIADPDSYLFQEALDAMSRIGSDAVVAELACRYDGADWDFRLATTEILRGIHSPLSTHTCMQKFSIEKDSAICTWLLEAGLKSFDTAAIEPARQFILYAEMDDDLLENFVLDLRSTLLTVCEATGEPFTELHQWRDDEDQARGTDALHQAQPSAGMDGLHHADEQTAEWFDFGGVPKLFFPSDRCPCRSGKTFGLCCAEQCLRPPAPGPSAGCLSPRRRF